MRLQELCKKYNIRFKKSLGQNLLLDENINRIMADAAALTRDDDVLEVGAGLGALTAVLSREARRVLAVEIDRAFMPCLHDQFGNAPNVVLFCGDILNHPLDELLAEHLPGGRSFKMVSNLPYYITTPVLFHFWESPVFFSRIVVMMQKEVAHRLVAAPGAPDYGVPALAARYYSEADIIRVVPRTCFTPRPDVDSCIVRLRNRPQPLYPDIEKAFLMRVIKTAFAQRRKTLRNSLTRMGGFASPKDAVLDALAATGIDPNRRPETLTLDEFAQLARAIRSRR
jgi:16S rRNA (adenine1518-N6/adenine1519-N6)-dimethyltransferase